MGEDRIVYVGHATVLIELDGVRLLTDPVLGGWVGPLRRHGPPPPRDLLEGVDAVLVSHLHRDHLELRSLRRAAGGVPLIVPAGAGRFFAAKGFGEVVELGPGESHRVGQALVTATAAAHEIGRRGVAAEPLGFLVEGTRRLYFAGDTDLFAGMAELGVDLDLALLPVWGWGPTLGPGHLDPERAARAAALLSPRIAVPIHWGTLYPLGLARPRPRPLSEPAREFAARARVLAPEVEVRVLMPGAALSLPPA
ncbi:MAG TPA: MBL fold metallo-hydrolase [Solirubrobacterales bacterium]|jgi:L-ascorbate metabolism protein UlaG (beta-lactamase superfamily)